MGSFSKSVEILETLSGLNIVSSGTLKKSKVKLAFFAFWVIVQSWNFLHFLISVNNDISVTKVERVYPYISTFAALYKTLVGSRSQVTSSLTLDAAKTKLAAAGIDVVPHKLFDVILLVSVVVLHLINTVQNVLASLARPINFMRLLRIFRRIHFLALQLALSVRYLYLKSTCKRIHRTINDVLETLRTQEEHEGQAEERSKSPRDTIQILRSNSQILGLLKKIRPSILHAERKVNAYFSIQILWHIVEVASKCPNIFCIIITKASWDFGLMYEIYLVMSILVFLVFIYTNVDGANDKLLSPVALGQFHSITHEDHRTSVTRHLLSTMHSAEVDSCQILDLDYSLTLDVIDYALLVFTTLCHS